MQKYLVQFLLFVQASWAQNDGPGYRNSDPPNCGSLHTRNIHGTVTDQSGAPVKDVEIEVFDDASHKFVGKTVTDKDGRFSMSQISQGRYRVVFSSPGFLAEDWAVTTMKWPDGGFFRSREIHAVLPVFLGDGVPTCRSEYSR
jgi:5-hydroxyisourate hydrolase-like protein (transthyretin family)